MNKNQLESRKLNTDYYIDSHSKKQAKCISFLQCWLLSDDLSDVPTNFEGRDCPDCKMYQTLWY